MLQNYSVQAFLGDNYQQEKMQQITDRNVNLFSLKCNFGVSVSVLIDVIE